jgi:hypothetical protein
MRIDKFVSDKNSESDEVLHIDLSVCVVYQSVKKALRAMSVKILPSDMARGFLKGITSALEGTKMFPLDLSMRKLIFMYTSVLASQRVNVHKRPLVLRLCM